jgi:hypothetical protein
MAAAPIQTAQKKRPRPVPDDALVYREYAHQVMQGGEWGAFSRTARICKVSHQHVRNVVERHTAKPSRNDAVLRDTSLEYEPAPGELEFAKERDADALLRQLLIHEIETEQVPVTSPPNPIANEPAEEFATFERSVPQIASDLFANAIHIDRTGENLRMAKWLMGVLCVGVTTICILVAQKSLGLSLALFPEVLGMWWVLGQAKKVVY